MSIYLVWSNEHGAWWRPERSGYTGDVWAAGRYDEDAAAQICDTRSWRKAGPPPEVMVLAPENDRAAFTPTEIRAVPDLMLQRIRKATRQRIAERRAERKAAASVSA